MNLEDFNYSLPKSFIAQNPAEPRDHSRLMVYDSERDEVFHRKFFEIEEFLQPNDIFVVNRSKVIPARILFDCDGRECEIFLLRKIEGGQYEVLMRPGKVFQKEVEVPISSDLVCRVLDVCPDGARIVEFLPASDVSSDFDIDLELEKLGNPPFPPYISESSAGFDQYQTVYAREKGSVAAPTAGLHFTDDLMLKLKNRGIDFSEVLLHVGRGTFAPVTTDKIEDHVMHTEIFELPAATATRLNAARADGRRLISVGTTSVRVLETCFDKNRDAFVPQKSATDIFIYPGYDWKCVDILLTNFHLPKSTLLMLCSSFLESKGVQDPVRKLMELYELAKDEEYRFFSFGDAMLIL